jgi:peroxiredoxin
LTSKKKPKDQTPGCTTQACEFRDNIFAFRDAGAQILGDVDPKRHSQIMLNDIKALQGS